MTSTDELEKANDSRLRDAIAEGVYRGVMKAVGVYALISLTIAVLVWLFQRLNSL